jgi:hypothetical protein
MRTSETTIEDDPGFQAFGDLDGVQRRRKELMTKSDTFLSGNFGRYRDDASRFKRRLRKLMSEYLGWAERRNDIAHGYVTEAQTPDYNDPNQNIITVYALCPSHARLPRWPHGEPEYNYVATELEEFAKRFQNLDERIEELASLAERLAQHRK